MAITLSGKQKAAMMMRLLDSEAAARLLKFLPERELMSLTAEVMRLDVSEAPVAGILLQEFQQLVVAPPARTTSSPELARELLETAFGPARASDLWDRLSRSGAGERFAALRRVPVATLLPLLQQEHPQIVALVLTFLGADHAAELLDALEPELQQDVSLRLATIDRVSPEALQGLEQALETRLAPLIASNQAPGIDGVRSLAGTLNALDRDRSSQLLDALTERDPELAERVRRTMFTFEDLINLDDRGIQRLLREVESSQLTLALKKVSPALREKIFKNMSARASQTLKEDIEIMGPARVDDVQAAQNAILESVRRLEESKEIVIGRGGGGDVIA